MTPTSAARSGAKIEEGTRVLGVRRDEHGVTLETDRGELRARGVVGAAAGVVVCVLVTCK